jgi:hypothetical protein
MDEKVKIIKSDEEVTMKKTVFTLGLIFCFVLMSNLRAAADQTSIDAKIERVISFLDKPEGPGKDGKTMVTLLIGVITEAAPETGFPPEFAENMEKAKEISDSTSVLNQDSIAYLHKAYRLINSGNDFEFPSSIKEIQDAVNYIKGELATAREKLKSGQTDACIEILLEVTLMIVTPVQR